MEQAGCSACLYRCDGADIAGFFRLTGLGPRQDLSPDGSHCWSLCVASTALAAHAQRVGIWHSAASRAFRSAENGSLRTAGPHCNVSFILFDLPLVHKDDGSKELARRGVRRQKQASCRYVATQR